MIELGTRLKVIKHGRFASFARVGSILEITRFDGDGYCRYSLVGPGAKETWQQVEEDVSVRDIEGRITAGLAELVDRDCDHTGKVPSEGDRLAKFFHGPRIDPFLGRLPAEWNGYAQARIPLVGKVIEGGQAGMSIRIPTGTIIDALRDNHEIVLNLRFTYPDLKTAQRADRAFVSLARGLLRVIPQEVILFKLNLGEDEGSPGYIDYVSGYREEFIVG